MEKNYLNEESFLEAIKESFKNDKLTHDAVLMYKSIVDNMIKHKNYNGYSKDLKMDMQNTAYFFFLKYWRGFKQENGRAFSYFTRMSQNGFRQEINKYYKYNKNFDIIYQETKLKDTTSNEGYDDDYDK